MRKRMVVMVMKSKRRIHVIRNGDESIKCWSSMAL